MKLIYHEIKREGLRDPYQKVEAYYNDKDSEPYDMPALIHIEKGEFDTDGDRKTSGKWYLAEPKDFHSLPLTEAQVIRLAIKIMDGGEQ
jgi:hypothetical protein